MSLCCKHRVTFLKTQTSVSRWPEILTETDADDNDKTVDEILRENSVVGDDNLLVVGDDNDKKRQR